MTVLIVEDEAELGVVLVRLCSRLCLPADLARTGAEARAYAREAAHDLLVFDRRLPDGDGLSLIAGPRAGRSGLPILTLTALDDVPDRIAGPDAGADDYLTKTVDAGELEAQLRALLRWPGLVAATLVAMGRLAFDTGAREARVRGEPMFLAARAEPPGGADAARAPRGHAPGPPRRGLRAGPRRGPQRARRQRVAPARGHAAWAPE